ncbi:MAG: DEAD/DEAH box helicase [Tissierellia bacterium]|nr:DEAD/DEAH box helicase [Tissierellia bacterium]
MKFKPYDYQIEAMNHIILNKKCALFLDMGLGKTVCTLTALNRLQKAKRINKILVVAPKRVANDTWTNEIEKRDHLKNIKYTLLTGNIKERKENLKKDVDIYITTKDLIKWVIKECIDKWIWDTLVIDELSSFKNPQSQRFKQLIKVIKKFKRVVGLTGTPNPNGYIDLWGQIYLLDQGQRLGDYYNYSEQYFRRINYGNYERYKVLPGKADIINEKIKDICISMQAKDYLSLEEPKIIDYNINLDQKELEKYNHFENEWLISLEGEDFSLFTNAALTGKLCQLSNGAIYNEEGDWLEFSNKKVEALKEFNDNTEENILVFYNFKSDLERIKKAIPSVRIMKTSEDIRDWQDGKVKIMLAHPASCGHGLNLQTGGHIIVWFGLNWSLELYLQANARLQRVGQTKPVVIYRFITKRTVEEVVARVLMNKHNMQETLLKYMKKRKNQNKELILSK